MIAAAWLWLVLGGALLVVEMLLPGFVFLWLAGGAVAVALLAWLLPGLGWQAQVLAFAAAVVAAVAGWFAWQRGRGHRLPHSTLNRRAEQLVGREAIVSELRGPGQGRVRVGDSSWLARGPDLAAGDRVRIVGVEGPVLLVRPAAAHHKAASEAGPT